MMMESYCKGVLAALLVLKATAFADSGYCFWLIAPDARDRTVSTLQFSIPPIPVKLWHVNAGAWQEFRKFVLLYSSNTHSGIEPDRFVILGCLTHSEPDRGIFVLARLA